MQFSATLNQRGISAYTLEEHELLHQKYQRQVPAGPVPVADSVNSCQYKASLQRD